jgi:hypothetical protein
MKWIANAESLKPRHYEIEDAGQAGYYLYVFEGQKCIRDDLQDSLEIAIDSAFENYHVPKNVWRQI